MESILTFQLNLQPRKPTFSFSFRAEASGGSSTERLKVHVRVKHEPRVFALFGRV